ncbi:hypothetical protein [Streptacidiphilus rugosus]|uniref:hypothetical protein n=1 Tax=Streptacidiphilus rugosus TaxID=405783 RepID=UPI00056245F0|nr:hypothetical protein [Streptacidiphilus rugosus]
MRALPWLAELLKRLGERTGRGAAAIGWRIAAWTLRKGPPKVRIGRLAVAAAAVWAGERVLAHQRLAAALIAIFLVVSYREGAAQATQAAPEPEEWPSADEILLGMVLDLIGDAPGIHLADLLVEVRKAGPDWAGFELPELREMLAAIGCPIRRQLRVGDRTGIPGVHRDDAQAALNRLNHSPDL